MTAPRNFQIDFLEPALAGLTRLQAQRVAVALDAAIGFGVLEYVEGNPSLQNVELVRQLYEEKIARLAGFDPTDRE